MATKHVNVADELLVSLEEATTILRGEKDAMRVHLAPDMIRRSRHPRPPWPEPSRLHGAIRSGDRRPAGLRTGPAPPPSRGPCAAAGNRPDAGGGCHCEEAAVPVSKQ